MSIGLVLDTSALLAYTQRSAMVGEWIAAVADEAMQVLVPALCLAEAYRRVDSDAARLIDVMAKLPVVRVVPVEHGHCAIVGEWARTLGSLDLAHAVVETAANPVVPLVTAERELVTRLLPASWPIVDL